ncbi:GT2 family glycosyltransferase [Oceanisphaera litoralis]|uniref:glycosyltransferase family 2 protein n=1 Tax=Oceanisphaera litoralis TaxID=225144 RepID=UPI00195716AE|nr:glycosyltransferase family 2 protein [Oceanisphaera litoralis]MBM7455575.1 GT2 family glycosyltransferase [Oceanisphaera litoralis]
MTQSSAISPQPQLQQVEPCTISAIDTGWVLVTGQLNYHGPELEARLLVRQKNGEQLNFDVPVTLKGKLYELVKLPGASQICLEVKSMGHASGLDTVSITQINWATAHYLMYRRIYHAYTTASHAQRRVLGLHPLAMLRDPYSAYALIGKSRYYTASPAYAQWIDQSEHFTPAVAHRLKRAVKKQALAAVAFEMLIDARQTDTPVAVQQTLHSLRQQLELAPVACKVLLTAQQRDEWAALLKHDIELITTNELAEVRWPGNNWVFVMQAGTRLAPWALAWMAMEAQKPDTAFIYSDNDYWLNEERVNPQFKPDWSQELARSSGYVGSAFALRGDLFGKVVAENGVNCAYQLVLDATALVGEQAICHIPAVLCHYVDHKAETVNRQALERHLRRNKVAAEVIAQGEYLRVRYALPKALPKVSIVVPTRDALNYLQPCVESLLQKTTWPDYELLIVDNQSSEPATLAYFEQVSQHERVRVLHYDQPFNFSAINNFAVAQASGEVVCLLNNDTEVISPDWLEEMVSRLLQPGVGVVGGRLYFSDGRVQHAGDVLGPGGCATHLHGILEADDPGYMHRSLLAQDLSAVTAACLVTHKALYQQLGGLDETNLTVAFNDVDYCLRVREAGERVIYTPYAKLYHHESVSRGKDDSPEKKARAKRETEYMRSRWRHMIDRDPFYNPNLNYSQPDFKLGKIPRVGWPW